MRASLTCVLQRSVLAAGLLLAGVAAPLGAEPTLIEGLRQALDGGATGKLALRDWIDRLAAQDARHRRRFQVAGAANLPGKAQDRLRAAQAAYEGGHGRLLQVLRELEAAERAPAEAAMRAGLRAEAQALVGRLELAARREPLSSALRFRAPELQAPALPALSAPGPDALLVTPEESALTAGAGTVIGPVPQVLRDLAASLSGPLEIYAWVRRNIASEFYYGVLKGAEQTYRERGGNDADVAALLVQLLRAKGFPARFVTGQAELPIATLQRLVGTNGTPEQAVRVLERAGIPHETVAAGGGIGSVKLARVWAEAYLPYVNYRGLELDAHGKAWVPLDAAFKPLVAPTGLDVVRELGFDPRATFDAYLTDTGTATPLEFARARVTALLAAERPGTTYQQALNSRRAEAEELGILPNTLPYAATRGDVGFTLPAALDHELRLLGRAGDTTVLDVRVRTADVLGGRVTLAYQPFDDDDRAVVARFGGLYQTPPYLIEVRPVVYVAGVAYAAGTAPVGFGVKYSVRLELKTPGGMETVDNTLLAGNLAALGLGGTDNNAPEGELPSEAARILAHLASGYLARWNQADEELANLLRVVPVRPTLSACFVMSDIEVDYAGGDPSYPLTYDWKGVAIDADFRPLAPVGLDERAREASFALWSGLHGSVLEHRIFEDQLQVTSVSTVKALQLASAQAIDVLAITRANAETVVPTLPFDESVKTEVLEAAQAGRLVRIPAAPVSLLAWTGVGYVILDEASGAASYQLQGGHSGGATAVVVNQMPGSLTVLQSPGAETADCGNVRPAAVARLTPQEDFQLGTVDKRLDDPLVVQVTDFEGQPLPKACVTFYVQAGGGKLVIPENEQEADVATVLSDSSGKASIKIKLGKKTGDQPRYICEDGRSCSGSGADEYTQVGMNVVNVAAGAASLSEPFRLLALPDTRCGSGNCTPTVRLTTATLQGATNMSVAGLMGVSVKDQFENPVSNFAVRFAYKSVELGVPPAGWSRFRNETTSTAGTVLKSKDMTACLNGRALPAQGDCQGEAPEVTVPSSVFGAYAYAAVADSPYSLYSFEIGSAQQPNLATAKFGTWGWLCHASDASACNGEQPTTSVFHGTRYRRVSSRGDFIEAYETGANADATFWAYAVLEENYVTEEGQDEYGKIYRAHGKNKYKRVVLTDSQFNMSAQTPGTGVSGASHVGNGDYKVTMTMSGTPQENKVSAQAKHNPEVVRYMDRDPRRVEPGTVADGPDGKVAIRSVDPRRPWTGTMGFPLWGVKLELQDPEPQDVILDENNRTRHSVYFPHKILPEAWRVLLESDPQYITFELGPSNGTPQLEAFGVNGEVFVVAPGAELSGHNLFAYLKARNLNPTNTTISSGPQLIQVGQGWMVHDANNDTKVDDTDKNLLKTKPGSSFAFWQAASTEVSEAALLDYATVNFWLPFSPSTTGEDFYFRLPGAQLKMMRKQGASFNCNGKGYLCDPSDQNAQMVTFRGNAGPLPESQGGGLVRIPADQLFFGTNEFLFACHGNCGDRTLSLLRKVRGQFERVFDLAVEIRPVTDWVSLYTIRRPGSFMPAQTGRLMAGFDVLPERNSNSIPERIDKLQVLVHGFNVAEEDAAPGTFFPIFKRMYWVGQRMHRRQGTTATGFAHTIGVAWPGNQGTPAPLFFPEDEFHALQSGVPMARFLACLRGNLDGSSRRVHVIAHSLGNMVMQSALMRLGNRRAVDKYVMYDAAFASESLNRNYERTFYDTVTFGPHVADYGYPSDLRWDIEWGLISIDPLSRIAWNLRLNSMYEDILPRPDYNRRWTQVRPFEVSDRASATSTPARGPWRGLFAVNPGRTEMINAFNQNDTILGLVWETMQRLQKPNFGPLGLLADGPGPLLQFWGRLPNSAAEEERVWELPSGAGCQATDTGIRHGNLIRQWAEVSHWFPSISQATGRTAQPFMSRNLNFSTYGDVLNPLTSHSYLVVRNSSDVWRAYEELIGALGN
jgi:transglutaminase-like putative cysteine protease